jgi:hypothetical protein
LMDDSSCHHSGECLDMCNDVGVLPTFLITHSSHPTQPLDVGLLAIHKSAIQRVRPASWMSGQACQITRTFGACQATKWHQGVEADRVVFNPGSGTSGFHDVGRLGHRAESRTRADSRRSQPPAVSNKCQTVTEA